MKKKKKNELRFIFNYYFVYKDSFKLYIELITKIYNLLKVLLYKIFF